MHKEDRRILYLIWQDMIEVIKNYTGNTSGVSLEIKQARHRDLQCFFSEEIREESARRKLTKEREVDHALATVREITRP